MNTSQKIKKSFKKAGFDHSVNNINNIKNLWSVIRMTYWDKLSTDFEEMKGQLADSWTWFNMSTDLSILAIVFMVIGGLIVKAISKHVSQRVVKVLYLFVFGLSFIWIIGSFLIAFLILK